MNYASPATFAYFPSVCESVLMMIQVGLIANLYARRRTAAPPARLGCLFFAAASPGTFDF